MTETTADTPDNEKLSLSPVEVRNTTDPGDSTQRNFRYQHAYGVMLLAAGKLGVRPYIAIWCEQHEDFLAERKDGKFDGFQIKTSKPENGAWRLNDPDLKKSFGRFVDLVLEFGDSIGNLYFVSNTEAETIGPQNANNSLRAQCPSLFLDHVRSCSGPIQISDVFKKTFLSLQADFGCSAESLFAVLRRIQIVHGPSRNEIDAALSHEHLAKVDCCKSLNAEKLDTFRDQLVFSVFQASSLQVDDPIRHLRPVFSQEELDPTLSAKRLLIEEVMIYNADTAPATFQYVGDPQLTLGEARPSYILEQKLDTGGLADQLDYMQERERSAERHLLEDVARRPERYPELMKQIEQVVLGECREAHLRARSKPAPYGPAMLADVQDRLRRLANEETALVGGHSYECLVGMAGLLTSECVVWWSPRFTIEKEDV